MCCVDKCLEDVALILYQGAVILNLVCKYFVDLLARNFCVTVFCS